MSAQCQCHDYTTTFGDSQLYVLRARNCCYESEGSSKNVSIPTISALAYITHCLSMLFVSSLIHWIAICTLDCVIMRCHDYATTFGDSQLYLLRARNCCYKSEGSSKNVSIPTISALALSPAVSPCYLSLHSHKLW